MFVQVIHGKVRDKAEVKAQLDRWVSDLAPDAVGWLGTTAGVTDDNHFIALARFESEAAADKNSSLPEQGAWWDRMAGVFEREPTFHNSTWADLDSPGDPGAAGFVQVMHGKVSDLDRLRGLLVSDNDELASARPDILGRLSCGHEDGAWTMAIWFASEAAAREGEQKELPQELQDRMATMRELSVGEPAYLDLRDPWMDGPG